MSSKTSVLEAGSDDEADQVVEPKPVKRTRKDRTPAQQEAFKKALSVLKEKREAVRKANDEKMAKASAEERALIEKEKFEKAKNHKKKLPPAPSYVTMADLDRFKNDILSAIPKTSVVERVVEKKEPVVEKPVVVSKPVERVEKKQLTGHELLDKLFFS